MTHNFITHHEEMDSHIGVIRWFRCQYCDLLVVEFDIHEYRDAPCEPQLETSENARTLTTSTAELWITQQSDTYDEFERKEQAERAAWGFWPYGDDPR